LFTGAQQVNVRVWAYIRATKEATDEEEWLQKIFWNIKWFLYSVRIKLKRRSCFREIYELWCSSLLKKLEL
jgi:hypothetical protein